MGWGSLILTRIKNSRPRSLARACDNKVDLKIAGHPAFLCAQKRQASDQTSGFLMYLIPDHSGYKKRCDSWVKLAAGTLDDRVNGLSFIHR